MARTRTSIRLDTRLTDQATKVFGVRSRAEAIHIALREIVAIKKLMTPLQKNSDKPKVSGGG
jgi:Arc/MetJ family transcription regulator